MYDNINVSESILFLTSARIALKETISLSNLTQEKKKELKNFVMKEATDYQVMSLLVNETLPDEKYNLAEEASLFDAYKDLMSENFDTFSKILSTDQMSTIITEVGPISQYGYSTAAPILEHLYESGVLSEGPISYLKNKIGDKSFDAKFKARGLSKSLPHKAKGMMKTAGEKVKAAPGQIKSAAKAAPGQIKSGVKSGVEATKKFAGTKTGKGLAIAAAAAAAIYAGSKAYKRFFSAAAKSCKGMSGSEKTACMDKFKANAVKAQIQSTMSGMNACNQSKDPAKCKQLIQNRVAKLRAKM